MKKTEGYLHWEKEAEKIKEGIYPPPTNLYNFNDMKVAMEEGDNNGFGYGCVIGLVIGFFVGIIVFFISKPTHI